MDAIPSAVVTWQNSPHATMSSISAGVMPDLLFSLSQPLCPIDNAYSTDTVEELSFGATQDYSGAALRSRTAAGRWPTHLRQLPSLASSRTTSTTPRESSPC